MDVFWKQRKALDGGTKRNERVNTCLRHSDWYLYMYYLNEGGLLRLYIVVVVFFDAIYMRKRKREYYTYG